MILIFGLGNPGKEYAASRHNLGWQVVEKLAQGKEGTRWQEKKRWGVSFCQLGEEVILAKPLKYMNCSGEVVGAMSRFYRVEPANIWLVHDDLDLELGRIKLAQGRGSAGHRGVQSVLTALGTQEVRRYRLGTEAGKEKETAHKQVADYVLRPFSAAEKIAAEKMIGEAVAMINGDLGKEEN